MNYLLLYYYMALAPLPQQPDTPQLHLVPVKPRVQTAVPGYYTFIGSNQPSTSLLNQLSINNLSGTVIDILFNLNESYRVSSAIKVAYLKVGQID